MMVEKQLPSIPLLSDLLVGCETVGHVPEFSVPGIALDSRQVRSGFIFFALAGERHHGLDYFDAVVKAGVGVVLVDSTDQRYNDTLKRAAQKQKIVLLAVHSLAQWVGKIAANFYAHPSADMTVIGVTGTDGKTSVSQFIGHALHHANRNCGLIGTLGSGVVGQLNASGLTTPDAVSVQQTLADFSAQKIDCVAMEVSSHALQQGRVNGVDFAIAVLTNLGRDHIDYHGSVEKYHAAKWQLLRSENLRTIVLNGDDKNIRRHLGQVDREKRICYASREKQRDIADVFAEDIVLSERGIQMTIVTSNNRLRLKSALVGRFNVDNLLATFCVMQVLKIDPQSSVKHLSSLAAVPGRAECFFASDKPTAVVDYSHTPQALQAILKTIRDHCAGQLWCVFGCGGDRDKGKRPLMAAAAEAMADHVVVTDDNPRTEHGDDIVKDILAGFAKRESVTVERDRKTAILSALDAANSRDWVVVAGKGHEDYQLVGTEKIHLSDRKIVAEALRGDSRV